MASVEVLQKPKSKRGEKLLRAIDPAGGEQFLCSYKAKFNALLIADKILTTITACKAHIARAVLLFLLRDRRAALYSHRRDVRLYTTRCPAHSAF